MTQDNNHTQRSTILVAVEYAVDLPLITVACQLARQRAVDVCVLTVAVSDERPAWPELPESCDDVSAEIVIRSDKNIGKVILREIRERDADTLIVGWGGRQGQELRVLERILDPVVQKAACDVILMRGAYKPYIRRVLLPTTGGPAAPEALSVARTLAPEADITALYVAEEEKGPAEVVVGEVRLNALLRGLPSEDRERINPRVIQAQTPYEGILEEAAAGYDLLVVDAGSEGTVNRSLFDNISQTVVAASPIPVMIVRRHLTPIISLSRRIWTFIFGLAPSLTVQEKAEISQNIHHSLRPSADFSVMLLLTTAIAALGLLLNSPAIIIGAMLVNPWLSPIVGMGASLASGDLRSFWTACGTAIRGMALAIVAGLIVGALVPGASATPEILGRANPSALNLVIALVSGALSAYVLCRRNVSSMLAGALAAYSLIPPLVAVGIGVVLRQWEIAGGALLFFASNLIAVIASSSLVFLLFGFRPMRGDAGRIRMLSRGFQSVAILFVFVAAFVVILTRQHLAEVRLQREIQPTLIETPTLLPTSLSTATPTSVPTATAMPSPTPTPSPTATATSTPAPTVTPPHTATPWMMFVAGVGDTGLRVRYSPDGTVMGSIDEGAAVIVVDGPIVVNETMWYRVVSMVDRLEGWVAADYLAPTAP